MNIFWPAHQDLSGIGGELILIATIIAVLLSPFFAASRSNITAGWITLIGLVIALVYCIKQPDSPATLFRSMVIIDPMVRFWKILLISFVIGVVGIWFTSTRHALRDGEAPEFFTLLISSTVGMMLMGGTSNLLMIVLASEIASMPSYLLAGFRKTSRRASEASMKYVLFGAVATAIMIYAITFLYGVHGTLSLSTIVADLRSSQSIPPVTIVGLVGLFLGLLFKLSAVPMHFWCPDVFEGSHVDVAAFLSVASKGAGLVLLMRLMVMFADVSPALTHGISITVAVVAVVTMTIGNFGALHQTSAKRILAYSSIAHAGYLMAALALVPMKGALVIVGMYLAIYLLMNLAAFAGVGVVENKTGSDHLSSFRGLISLSPLVAIALAISLLSMVGLPPMGGFFAKLRTMAILGSAGGWWWVVVAAVAINSIISLAYYARILKPAFLEKPESSESGYTGAWLAIAFAILVVASFILIGRIESISAMFEQQYGPKL